MQTEKKFTNATLAAMAIDNMVDLFCDHFQNDWYNIDKNTFKEFCTYAERGEKISFSINIRKCGTDAVYASDIKYCQENLNRLERSDIRFNIRICYVEGLYYMTIESK